MYIPGHIKIALIKDICSILRIKTICDIGIFICKGKDNRVNRYIWMLLPISSRHFF